jgi:hypothetical protein
MKVKPMRIFFIGEEFILRITPFLRRIISLLFPDARNEQEIIKYLGKKLQ